MDKEDNAELSRIMDLKLSQIENKKSQYLIIVKNNDLEIQTIYINSDKVFIQIHHMFTELWKKEFEKEILKSN